MKISAFVAASLDGYIARKNGDLQWLDALSGSNTEEDFGYKAYISTVTCLLMGRNTFEKVLQFTEWPYPDKRVIVISRTLAKLTTPANEKAELYSGSLESLVQSLENEGEQHLYVDGGQTIQAFIQSNRLDELTITRIPILLCKGIPLFRDFDHDILLKHQNTISYSNGFVQSTYTIK